MEVRSNLRIDLVDFPQIIEGDPQQWWRKTVKYVLRLKHQLDTKPLEIQEYLGKYLPEAVRMLAKNRGWVQFRKATIKMNILLSEQKQEFWNYPC